jgi:hypothetical protein
MDKDEGHGVHNVSDLPTRRRIGASEQSFPRITLALSIQWSGFVLRQHGLEPAAEVGGVPQPESLQAGGGQA